jgi:hypothetical protein
VTVDPAWASAAASYGSVAVLVGPYLCVRTPPGKTPATYTAQEKLEEFRRGRRMGLCTVGSVLWHPTPPPEALNWALFQPAAFGVPWPVAYVPQWNFTPYGGPQALGFTPPIGPPPPEGRHVSIHATTKLIAVVTGTDLDLHRTNQDPDISYITGYHDMNRDGFFTAWQQAAHAYGQILIITGEQEMPCEPGTTVAQAQQVLSDSWTAIVTVHSTLGQPTSDPWDLP